MALKPLTLKSYLFLLVALLICLLALSQLTLIYYMQSSFNHEVDQKATKISEQLVELAVDNLEINHDIDTHIVKLQSKNQGNKHSKNQNITEKLANEQQEIQVFTLNDDKAQVLKVIKKDSLPAEATMVDKTQIAKQLKKVLKEYKNKHPNSHNEPKWVQYQIEQTQTDSLNPLFQQIQLAIVVTALLALGFAYWLSKKFNQPLANLTQGFAQLAEGNYQIQVAESGVAEIRNAISQFNQMSNRLKQLTELENRHLEIEHLAELGEVSRGLAHALRSPLHTLGLLADKLKTAPPSEHAELIRQINDKILNIDRYIKALLTLTNKGIDRRQRLNILTILQDIKLELLNSHAQPVHIDLNCDASIELIGDESEIRSILHTLVQNAVSANIEQNSPHAVVIKVYQNKQELQIQVEDHGSGISENIAKSLFKPHISTKADGAGMGLYIAQRLIRLHYHGQIGLKNCQQHQGCIATATFKLNQQES